MLTLTPDAVALIQSKDKPIFLELPKTIINCCFDFQECPVVRFGEPRNMRDYEKKIMHDVTIFVPSRLRKIPLTITVSSFLGLKRLVVDDWSLL